MQVSETCGQYDSSTGECLTCISQKYVLLNKECVIPSVDNCDEIENNVCTKCKEGYELESGQCMKEWGMII